jgi:hypothetical protein
VFFNPLDCLLGRRRVIGEVLLDVVEGGHASGTAGRSP